MYFDNFIIESADYMYYLKKGYLLSSLSPVGPMSIYPSIQPASFVQFLTYAYSMCFPPSSLILSLPSFILAICRYELLNHQHQIFCVIPPP